MYDEDDADHVHDNQYQYTGHVLCTMGGVGRNDDALRIKVGMTIVMIMTMLNTLIMTMCDVCHLMYYVFV